MKKLCLIVAQTDIVNVLTELIDLKCIEPAEPEIAVDPPELSKLINHEVMELANYDANFDSIDVLATQYTYVIAGWLPAEYEPRLTAMLARFVCAWEITDLTPADADNAPIVLKYPAFFTRMRSNGRRIFVPLMKSNNS